MLTKDCFWTLALILLNWSPRGWLRGHRPCLMLNFTQCVLKQAVVSYAIQLDIRKFELAVLLAKFFFKDAQLLLQSFTIFNLTVCVLWTGWQFANITFTLAVQWLVDAVVVLKLIQVDVVKWENFFARTVRNICCTCALNIIDHFIWQLPTCLVRMHDRNWFLLHGR